MNQRPEGNAQLALTRNTTLDSISPTPGRPRSHRPSRVLPRRNHQPCEAVTLPRTSQLDDLLSTLPSRLRLAPGQTVEWLAGGPLIHR